MDFFFLSSLGMVSEAQCPGACNSIPFYPQGILITKYVDSLFFLIEGDLQNDIHFLCATWLLFLQNRLHYRLLQQN